MQIQRKKEVIKDIRFFLTKNVNRYGVDRHKMESRKRKISLPQNKLLLF